MLADLVAEPFAGAGWSAADRALVDYADKLTRAPQTVTAADIARLRDAGFDDRAIHDLCSIVGYFAFVNRIADGLGVELEPGRDAALVSGLPGATMATPGAPTSAPAGVRTEPFAHVSRSGSFHLPVVPAEAFPFFTPEGERSWVPGWQPEYLHPPDGRLQRGLVFRTAVGGEETLWLVLRADRDVQEAEYARLVPGSRIGTVTVRCRAATGGGTEVGVRYELTAVSEAGTRTLAAFTNDAFAEMLDEWRTAVLQALGRPGAPGTPSPA